MNKISTFCIVACLMVISSCETKTADTEHAQKDSVKNDTTTIVPATTIAEPEIELSGNALIIAKKWKAIEFESTTNLPPELVEMLNIRFDFKKSGLFEYSEDGKNDTGKWSLSEDGKVVNLEYDKNNIKAALNIKELKEDKLVLAGKEHGMYRKYVLAPQK